MNLGTSGGSQQHRCHVGLSHSPTPSGRAASVPSRVPTALAGSWQESHWRLGFVPPGLRALLSKGELLRLGDHGHFPGADLETKYTSSVSWSMDGSDNQ